MKKTEMFKNKGVLISCEINMPLLILYKKLTLNLWKTQKMLKWTINFVTKTFGKAIIDLTRI